jgi:hypothetical protein
VAVGTMKVYKHKIRIYKNTIRNPESRFRAWKNAQQGDEELTALSTVLSEKMTGPNPVKSPHT